MSIIRLEEMFMPGSPAVKGITRGRGFALPEKTRVPTPGQRLRFKRKRSAGGTGYAMSVDFSVAAGRAF